MYKYYIIKRKFEALFIFPFIWIGRQMAKKKPLDNNYEVFFFFPFYHIGGAEKVHYQIAKAIGGKNCIIFFTRKSQNNLYYDFFKQSGCKLVDISAYTDNKFKYFNNLIYRGIISFYINNQHTKPLVFNGQCNFAYKLSPWIKPIIPQIELIHSLCSFSYIRIPFIEYYYKTVMISRQRIIDHERLYDLYNIPTHFKNNIVFILNGIPLPAIVKKLEPITDKPLRVLYVGRDTEEKRVHLIAQVAKEIKAVHQLPAEFFFMGDVERVIPAALHSYCTFLGNQTEEQKIDSIYMESDVLLLLSKTEGFPMAIMEAMAKGLTIVSTAVGEIPSHVVNAENGFLINEIEDNEKIVAETVEIISELIKNKEQLIKIGNNNIQHAFALFGFDRFAAEYRQLFEEAKKHFHK